VQLSRRRQLQVIVVLGLTIASTLSEMLSLGAVVPFLAVLAKPDAVWSTGKAQWIAGLMGWQHPADLLLPLCVAFAASALLSGFVRIYALRKMIVLANDVGSDLSIEVYKRTLYQPYAVHLQRNSSETISAISNHVEEVVRMLNGLLQLVSAGLVSTGLMALLIWLNPGVILAMATLVGGGYGLLMGLSQRQLQRLGPEILRDQAQLIRSLQEGLGAIRDVILDGNQPVYEVIYREADQRMRRHRGTGQFMALAPRYGMEAVGLVAIALAALSLMAGGSGFLGAIPLLGAIGLGAQRLLPSLQLIYSSWSSFRINLPALVSVLDYMDQPVDDADLTPVQAPIPFKSEIQFQKISFRYGPDLPWVLHDLSLTIRRGERIGIVGETGSGKSTLVDLLMGLLEPTIGELTVDGEPVRNERLRPWRRSIAHVPQSIFLADASIAENIALGVHKKEIDEGRLKQASEQAMITGFISSLAKGYDTGVGERGVKLSGGQRQRIGIARALYKQAPILVFDEATSALDKSTEKEVMEAIDALSKELTIVIIAHRLSTLERCDRIVMVQQGRLLDMEAMQPEKS
jgi:ATP-binding cassette subfamily B protein